MLQFTGVCGDPGQGPSVDYAMRDGTATAASGYLPVRGRFHLYPNESQAVVAVAVAVEIIGDTTPEPRESFDLDVFHPVGAVFGEGVVQLTAVRKILDDDGWFG